METEEEPEDCQEFEVCCSLKLLFILLQFHKKTEYSWHDARGKYKNVKNLRSHLKKLFADKFCDIQEDEIEFGYVSLCHGAKGQQLWVTEDSDLREMYASHKGKRKVMIWFFTEKLRKSSGSKKK